MSFHSFTLYTTTEHLTQSEDYQNRLAQRGITCHITLVPLINAKFLRQHTDLALTVDDDGLSLAANGMKMNPHWQSEIARLKRASLKSEMILRACNISDKPTLIDATAGLAHDSLLLAYGGADVTLIERHPILFTLLEAQLNIVQHDPFFQAFLHRLTLVFADAEQYLTQLPPSTPVDVIYLDPMFPQRNQNTQKKAQVKKQMQLLHVLLEDKALEPHEQNPQHIDLGDRLLPLAQQHAKRVIVKRPRHAVFLNQQSPTHQWLGDACRFDAYF